MAENTPGLDWQTLYENVRAALKCTSSERELQLEARVERLEKALESVDRQTPDAIGGASYEISPGALYKVRAALYGSGGPRSKGSTPKNTEHQEEEEGDG